MNTKKLIKSKKIKYLTEADALEVAKQNGKTLPDQTKWTSLKILKTNKKILEAAIQNGKTLKYVNIF